MNMCNNKQRKVVQFLQFSRASLRKSSKDNFSFFFLPYFFFLVYYFISPSNIFIFSMWCRLCTEISFVNFTHTHQAEFILFSILLLLLIFRISVTADYLHEGQKPKAGMPSVGVFLSDPNLFLRMLSKLRRKPRKTPNDQVDERDMGSNWSTAGSRLTRFYPNTSRLDLFRFGSGSQWGSP